MPNNIIKGQRLIGTKMIGPNPPPPPSIGDAYGGGYFVGQISTAGTGVATHNLVIAPVSTGETLNLAWKTSQTSTSGTSSLIDGPANSSAMNDSSHPAAQFCENLSIGGYSDWYLPAKDELEICFYNFKPNTRPNDTTTGANTYAVPIRSSNYSYSSNPSQTSVLIFRAGGAEAFTQTNYWSSTQAGTTSAWRINFYAGNQQALYGNKTLASGRTRAVRRVPI